MNDEKRTCLKLYPGCDDCPYIGKGWDRTPTTCPYYLGLDGLTPEQSREYEKIRKLFTDHKRTMQRYEDVRSLRSSLKEES